MSNSNHIKVTGRRYVSISKLVSPDELRRLYEDELLTDAEIARMFGGASDVSVSQYRKRYGIQTITARQRKELREGKPSQSIDDLSPAKLRDLYSRMGDGEIGKLCGVSKPTIRKLRHVWGIEPISKSERSTSKEELTDEQKEVLIGITLGDGHILPRGSFKVDHAFHQYLYLRECHQILRSIARPIAYEETVMKQSGELACLFLFRTVQHVWLKAMRKLFYPDDEKVFPSSILDGLTPRSLAFWYFDDGHLSDGLPSFALGKISTDAAEEVCDRVAQRFGFSAYVSPRSAPTCKIMAFRANSCDLFFHLVREHATPDMLYKIPERYWPKDVKPVPKTRTTEQTNLPKVLRQHCVEWLNLAEDDRAKLLDNLVTFWRQVGFPHHVQRIEHLTVISNLDESQIIQGDSIKARQVGQSSC